jgi:hypothetical protein
VLAFLKYNDFLKYYAKLNQINGKNQLELAGKFHSITSPTVDTFTSISFPEPAILGKEREALG